MSGPANATEGRAVMERMVASFNALAESYDKHTELMKLQLAQGERQLAAQQAQIRSLMEYSAAFQEQVGVLVRVLSSPTQAPRLHSPHAQPALDPLAAAAHGFLSRLAGGGRPPGY